MKIFQDSPYQKWWIPPKEIIIIKKKNLPNRSLPSTNEKAGNEAGSQVCEYDVLYIVACITHVISVRILHMQVPSIPCSRPLAAISHDSTNIILIYTRAST